MELVSILLSTCFFSLVSSQYTYWVDDASCRPNIANDPRRANFDAALAGAIDLAARGYARLQSATDVDMKTNFNNVFQTDYGADPNAVGQVNDLLGTPPNPANNYQGFGGVASWTRAPANGQQASNLRIYCDNDEQDFFGGSRWTLKQDLPLQSQWPGYVPMILRPRAFQPGQPLPNTPGAPLYQEWEDLANGVQTMSEGCGTIGVQAETHNILSFAPPPGQPNIRSVITICDLQLNSQLHSFDNIPLKKDLNNAIQTRPNYRPSAIDAFASMTAFTMLHEFCHASPYFKVDHPMANGLRAYDWADLVSIGTANSLANVNNNVYLALLGKLADRHWRLSKRYNDWHNRGTLVYDLHGITTKVRRKWKEWAA